MSAWAVALISVSRCGVMGLVGFARTVARESEGTTSFRSSMRLRSSSGPRPAWPVMFPPGRAKLATKPARTGSLSVLNTIGIVAVASFAACAEGADEAKITSTLRRTRSSARARRCSYRSPPNRYSITRLSPSTQPNPLNTSLTTSACHSRETRSPGERNPTRAAFPACCASAACGAASSDMSDTSAVRRVITARGHGRC